MIIGNFTYSKDDNQYAGSIQTLSSYHDDVLIQPASKSGKNGPDYRVVLPNAQGIMELGAAWKKQGTNGKDYLSIQFDDPAMTAPFYASLLLPETGSNAILVWSRPSKGKKKED
jgi:uncharacterized protein (DUF736 family)